MFLLNSTPYFAKKVKKLLRTSPDLKSKLIDTLNQLQTDPLSTNLKSHKVVTPKNGICFSSRVTGDLRIIWNYSETEIRVLDLLDVGGHSGAKGVY